MRAEFVEDEKLRQRIETSLTYILTLLESAKVSSEETFKTETYRVIILYCVAIIEALLFSIYQSQKQRIHQTEFADINELSDKYQHKKISGRIVLAVRREYEKSEVEIGLYELINFFKGKTLLPETVDRMLQINNLRNSFHFRKRTSRDCTVKDVEEALELLEYTIQHTPRFIKVKN